MLIATATLSKIRKNAWRCNIWPAYFAPQTIWYRVREISAQSPAPVSKYLIPLSQVIRSFVLILTRNNGTEPRAPIRGQALQHAAQARARVAEDTSHAPVLRTGRKHLAIISAGEGEGS
jgi:hypothetical protein